MGKYLEIEIDESISFSHYKKDEQAIEAFEKTS